MAGTHREMGRPVEGRPEGEDKMNRVVAAISTISTAAGTRTAPEGQRGNAPTATRECSKGHRAAGVPSNDASASHPEASVQRREG